MTSGSQKKKDLDKAEGLNNGYAEKPVEVTSTKGKTLKAFTYYATKIDPSLKPYHCYKDLVIKGAKENCLPDDYIKAIACVESVDDPDPERSKKQLTV